MLSFSPSYVCGYECLMCDVRIGTERGSNIGGTMMDCNANSSELVDVYDITGKLVRKQVKRADAVNGLKKGIYIAGGKKYVVAGN